MKNKLYKFPRIYHLPDSPGLQNDDRRYPDMSFFDGKEVIASVKMDGENTTWYTDNFHARSLDSQFANHPSRDYVKGLWAQYKYMIPNNMRICGENLYAIHSIEYDNLSSYFQVFSIWEDNKCLSWEGTVEICQTIGLITVPVFYKGIFDLEKIEKLYFDTSSDDEGFVIRIADEFEHDFDNEQFFQHLVKYVRKNHVQTDQHWMKNWNKLQVNRLRND